MKVQYFGIPLEATLKNFSGCLQKYNLFFSWIFFTEYSLNSILYGYSAKLFQKILRLSEDSNMIFLGYFQGFRLGF